MLNTTRIERSEAVLIDLPKRTLREGRVSIGYPLDAVKEPSLHLAFTLRYGDRGRSGGERRAAQIARILQIVVGAGTVHGALVVPHDQIADAPLVTVDEFALCRVLGQFT